MKKGVILLAFILLTVPIVADRYVVTLHEPLRSNQITTSSVGLAVSQVSTITHVLKNVPAVIVETDDEGYVALQSLPGVIQVAPEVVFHKAMQDSVPIINADDVHALQENGANISGSGQTICVIDTGILNSHPDLSSRIVAEQCYCALGGGCCPNGNSTQNGTGSAADDESHGTHVAGSAAASGNLTGVAPNASLVAVKILDSNGDGGSGDLILAIDFCLEHNATALSMSFATMTLYNNETTCNQLVLGVTQGFNAARTNGSIPVAASGNAGNTASIGWPACITNVTSVGSTTKADALSSFTNRGALLDLVAPGSSINSTWYLGGYGLKSGTSMATPHVAAAALLLKQYSLLLNNVVLTPGEAQAVLENTGVPVGGYPRIDVLAAINSMLPINSSDNSISTPAGKISFGVNLSTVGFQGRVKIGNRFVSVNTNEEPGLNTSAMVTIENVTCPFARQNLIVANGHFTTKASLDAFGRTCPPSICSNVACNAGVLTFDVSHFSGFAAGGNANLTINDSAENSSVDIGTPINFSAFYVNATGGAHINGANCTASFDDGTNTVMNDTGFAYFVQKTYAVGGLRSWNVTCSQTGFTQLTAQDTVLVIAPVPEFGTIALLLALASILGFVFVRRQAL